MSEERRDRVEARPDDFEHRREHLKELSDGQLKERFWDLADQLVEPMVRLAAGHTSPSIERSVLLRMGFSGLQAQGLVQAAESHGLLGHGVGHVVLKAAEVAGTSPHRAAEQLLAGELWEQVIARLQSGGGTQT